MKPQVRDCAALDVQTVFLLSRLTCFEQQKAADSKDSKEEYREA